MITRRKVFKFLLEYLSQDDTQGFLDATFETETSVNILFDPSRNRTFWKEKQFELPPYLYEIFGIRLIFTPSIGNSNSNSNSNFYHGIGIRSSTLGSLTSSGGTGNRVFVHIKQEEKNNPNYNSSNKNSLSFLSRTQFLNSTSQYHQNYPLSPPKQQEPNGLRRNHVVSPTTTDEDEATKEREISEDDIPEEELLCQVSKVLEKYNVSEQYEIRLIRKRRRNRKLLNQHSPQQAALDLKKKSIGTCKKRGNEEYKSPTEKFLNLRKDNIKIPEIEKVVVPSTGDKQNEQQLQHQPSDLTQQQQQQNVTNGGNNGNVNPTEQKYMSTLCLYRILWPINKERYIQTDNLRKWRKILVQFLSCPGNSNRWWPFKDICRQFSPTGVDDFKNAFFRYQLLPVTRPMKEFTLGPFFNVQKIPKSQCGSSKSKSNSKGMKAKPSKTSKTNKTNKTKTKEEMEGKEESKRKAAKSSKTKFQTSSNKTEHVSESKTKTKTKPKTKTKTKIKSKITTKTKTTKQQTKNDSKKRKHKKQKDLPHKDSRKIVNGDQEEQSHHSNTNQEIEIKLELKEKHQPHSPFGESEWTLENLNKPSSSGIAALDLEDIGERKLLPKREKEGKTIYSVFSFRDEKNSERMLYYHQEQLDNLWKWCAEWSDEKKEIRARAKAKRNQEDGQKAHRRTDYANEKLNIMQQEQLLAEIHSFCKTGKEHQLRSTKIVLSTKELLLKYYPDIKPGLFFRRGSSWEIAYIESLDQLLELINLDPLP
jgi:hypothetical protein